MFALRNLTLVYFLCFFVCVLLNFITDGAFMTTRTGALLFQALSYSFICVGFLCTFIFIRFKCPHCGKRALETEGEDLSHLFGRRRNYFAFRCVNCGAPLGASSKSGGKK